MLPQSSLSNEHRASIARSCCSFHRIAISKCNASQASRCPRPLSQSRNWIFMQVCTSFILSITQTIRSKSKLWHVSYDGELDRNLQYGDQHTMIVPKQEFICNTLLRPPMKTQVIEFYPNVTVHIIVSHCTPFSLLVTLCRPTNIRIHYQDT